MIDIDPTNPLFVAVCRLETAVETAAKYRAMAENYLSRREKFKMDLALEMMEIWDLKVIECQNEVKRFGEGQGL